MNDHALVQYDEACRLIAVVKTLDEAKDWTDKANAIRVYAKQARNKSLELDAMEIRLRAERRMGELIADQKRTVGLDPGGRPSEDDEDDDTRLSTLSEMGISRNLSSRAQKMASLNDDEFETYLAEVRDDGDTGVQRVTARLLKRVSGEGGLAVNPDVEGKAATSLQTLIEQGQQFATIYMDPPWQFETRSDKGKDRSPDRHYPTMTIAEIAALPIPDLCAPNTALYMWATWPMLQHALGLFDRWGCRFSTCALVWVKTKAGVSAEVFSVADLFMGTGYWSRANTEFVLLGTRGHPVRLNADVHQVIIAPIMEHSRKPDEAARRIERLSPGPYLEMFARRTTPGWVSWGNQISGGIDGGAKNE